MFDVYLQVSFIDFTSHKNVYKENKKQTQPLETFLLQPIDIVYTAYKTTGTIL